jgi:hypothetical protein
MPAERDPLNAYRIDCRGDEILVRMTGELDVASPNLTEHMRPLLRPGVSVVLDLGSVTSATPAGCECSRCSTSRSTAATAA